jgi:hypothetical protein
MNSVLCLEYQSSGREHRLNFPLQFTPNDSNQVIHWRRWKPTRRAITSMSDTYSCEQRSQNEPSSPKVEYADSIHRWHHRR